MEEENEKPENQWSAKKIITRVIAYPFCAVVLWGCYYMIFGEDSSLRQIMLGIIGFGIVGAYIGSDILMIIRSQKNS